MAGAAFLAYSPAIAGLATTLTALLLWRQERSRKRAETPVFLPRRVEPGPPAVVTLAVHNPSNRHWRIAGVRVLTRGVILATFADSGRRDAMNAPISEMKVQGRRVQLDIDLPPAFIQKAPAHITLALKAEEALPATVALSFALLDGAGQKRVRRHTATSSIRL